MEGLLRGAEGGSHSVVREHVWRSRISDLTVVNLRDPDELLGTLALPFATPAAEVKKTRGSSPPPTGASAPPARPTTGKQESLHALLAKLQLNRPMQEAKPQVAIKLAPPQVPVCVAPRTSPLTPPAPLISAASPSPASAIQETREPSFPDPKESSSGPSGQFEFITGTNIPGQGVVRKAETVDESSSMALFHDPLWGGALDAFTALQPSKPISKPTLRSALSELYGGDSSAANTFVHPIASSTHGSSIAGASSASSMPVNSMPASMTPLAMPTQMGSSALPMMNALLAHSSPQQQQASPYPIYSLPIQYVAQQQQFPTGMLFNAPGYFPYGATTFMMPQPQPIQHVYPMPNPPVMRPGTNAKAMPFVPGGAM